MQDSQRQIRYFESAIFVLRAIAVNHAGNELHFNCKNHEHCLLQSIHFL